MERPASEGPSVGALAHLPAAVRALLPELDALPWAEESRADCARCVMTAAHAGEPEDSPWVFHPDARCCTYHPSLANFLAGGALRQGGEAARLVRARIRTGGGVSARGIQPSAAWAARYDEVAEQGFGRDLALRCPYWVGGDHACGVWQHRPATCRTWFCKHDQGLGGAAVWGQLKQALARAEALLARFCVERGQPPAAGSTDPDAWERWYAWCAGRVDRATAAELEALAHPELITARADLVTLGRRPRRVLPDVVVPAVAALWREPRGVRLSGYSSYDTVMAPPSIFGFLSRLDGVRTWREALAMDADGPAIDEELVRELHRIGALEAPGAPDATLIHRAPWPGSG